jgi:DNA-binding NarL/FixJ family response regulator
MKKIRLFIIDEHPAVCQALVIRLNAVSSVEVVGSACTYADGLTGVRTVEPDVILLELKGKSDSGLETLDAVSRLLARGPSGVIVLTSYLDETERRRALEAGAHRYLLKNIDTQRLVTEIEAVAREATTRLPGRPIIQDRPASDHQGAR